MDRSPSQVSQRRQGSPGAHCSCIFAMHDCYGSRADVPSSLRALTVRDSPPVADALVAALPPGPLFALMAGSSCRLMPSVPLLLKPPIGPYEPSPPACRCILGPRRSNLHGRG